MASIIIIYSTTDGHTGKICRHLQNQLLLRQHTADVFPILDFPRDRLEDYDKIVIGASIRYGKHSPEVFAFINRYRDLLESRPSAFFTVNIVARKPEKNRPETNPYMKKFLSRIPWRPGELAVFAGRLDYPRYSFIDRTMIRFIMLITNGPTAPDTVVEFTDWDRVDEFAEVIAAM